jgi:hypothetical protein
MNSSKITLALKAGLSKNAQSGKKDVVQNALG